MQGHLSDGQVTEVLLGSSDTDSREHLETCPLCRSELVRLQAGIVGLVEHLRGAAERPESFWRQQRIGVVARLMEYPSWQPWWRWAWVAAMTLLVLAATFLTREASPPPPVAGVDPDHVLLLDVERSIRSEVPEALRPAALLAQEVGQVVHARSNP